MAGSSILVACGDDTGTDGSGGSGSTSSSTTATTTTTTAVTTSASTTTGMVDAAPGPVTAFTAVASGLDIDLSWTNPTDADLADILIVRGEGVPVTFTPTDGMTYTAGMAAGTGQEVLFVGTGTAASLAAATPGVGYEFSAWARDAAGQFSVVAETSGVQNQIGTQTGQIEIALDGTVTVTQQPANLTLGGTATVNVGGGTIDLDLSVQNDTGRLIFNLKALSDTVSDGDVAGGTFPVGIGLPSTYFGPEALDTAAQATRTINLVNVTGAVDPVVLDVHFVDAPMIFGNDTDSLSVTDSSGSGETTTVSYSSLNPTSFYNAPRAGAISADGRRLYAGHKSDAIVLTYDTVTLTPTVSTDLSTNGFGSVGGVKIGPDGTVYALINDGAHWYGTDGAQSGVAAAAVAVKLVKLDPTTLAVTATLPIVAAGTNGESGFMLELLPGGDRLVVATGNGGGSTRASLGASTTPGELHFVDLATFTEVDTDSGTAGIQPVTVAEARVAAVAAVGNQLVVTFDTPVTENQVQILDLTTFGLTTKTVSATGDRISGALALGGRVLISRRNRNVGTIPLTTLNLTANTETTIDPGFTNVYGVAASPDGSRYFVSNNGTFATFDAATDAHLDVDGDAGNGVTDFSGAGRRHLMVLSPF